MTQEKFHAYEKVRRSGRTNMFDVARVVILSGRVLTRQDCIDIMKHYEEYLKQFGEPEWNEKN